MTQAAVVVLFCLDSSVEWHALVSLKQLLAPIKVVENIASLVSLLLPDLIHELLLLLIRVFYFLGDCAPNPYLSDLLHPIAHVFDLGVTVLLCRLMSLLLFRSDEV